MKATPTRTSRVKPLVLLCLPVLCLLGSCRSTSALSLPEHRPADFTLGVVVFHNQPPSTTAQRPARYIVQTDGILRASVGDGSGPLTYPPITRRLDQQAFDRVWELTHALSIFAPAQEGDDQTPVVRSPETYAPASASGYLIEIRSRNDQDAWAMPLDDPSARALVRELAALAWIEP